MPALNSGFRYAFVVTAGIAAAGALLTLVLIRRQDVAAVEAAPALDAA